MSGALATSGSSPILLSNPNQRGKLSSIANSFSLNQLLSVAINSSVIVKSLCVGLLIGYLISFKTSVNQYLSVLPGKLLPPNFFLWTLVTHSFIEYHFIQVIVDWFIILLFSKMIEPLWGSVECVQFYFVVTVFVALSTAFVYFIAFACTFNELLLFNTSVHGLGGLLGGFSVAIKQIMPDTILINFSFIRIKQDHLPLMLILTSLILYFVRLTNLTYFIMLTFGVLIGWTYLRFFQKHKNGSRGDSSSNFVFASFFPSQIQPFVAIISNTIFNLLVKVKICKQPPKRYNVSSVVSGGSSSSQSHITISIPLIQTAENSDAERRRLKALKALKERLKKPDEEDVKTDWADSTSTLESKISEESETRIEKSSEIIDRQKAEQDKPEASSSASAALAVNDNQ